MGESWSDDAKSNDSIFDIARGAREGIDNALRYLLRGEVYRQLLSAKYAGSNEGERTSIVGLVETSRWLDLQQLFFVDASARHVIASEAARDEKMRSNARHSGAKFGRCISH